MDKQKTIETFELFGCNITFVNTKNKKRTQGFVFEPTGHLIGTITMLKGHYSNIQWQAGGANKYRYYHVAIHHYITHGHFISRKNFDLLWQKAEALYVQHRVNSTLDNRIFGELIRFKDKRKAKRYVNKLKNRSPSYYLNKFLGGSVA